MNTLHTIDKNVLRNSLKAFDKTILVYNPHCYKETVRAFIFNRIDYPTDKLSPTLSFEGKEITHLFDDTRIVAHLTKAVSQKEPDSISTREYKFSSNYYFEVIT